MKRALFSKAIAAVALAVGALGVAAGAPAQPDIRISVGLPGPPAFFAPPRVARPQPAFDRRDAVYAQPLAGDEHGGRAPYRADQERERAAQQAEWRHRQWQRREWERSEWQRREWERHHRDRSPLPGRGRD